MYQSLIYLSQRPLAVVNPDRAMPENIAVARSRNASLDVTGALASTTAHYVQLLEGPTQALAELMETIKNDSRHFNVDILATLMVPQRSLPKWSMAFAGTRPALRVTSKLR